MLEVILTDPPSVSNEALKTSDLGFYRVEGEPISVTVFDHPTNRFLVGLTAEFARVSFDHPPVPCVVRADGKFVTRQRHFIEEPQSVLTYREAESIMKATIQTQQAQPVDGKVPR